MAAFLWHQIHLTIYLAGPVLLGLWVLYLMRNQGWWDAQRFWRRTTVLVILAPVFVAAYLGVLVGVTVVAEAIYGQQQPDGGGSRRHRSGGVRVPPRPAGVAGWVDLRFFPSRRIADEW